MKTRKTLLASALIAAGTLALAAPPYLGRELERQFRSTVAQHGRGPLHWQLLHYERGLYASRARSRVELLSPEGEALGFELDHRILHGFGLAGFSYGRVTTTLRLDGEAGAALRTLFGDAEPLRLVNDFGLDGDIRGRIVSPPVEGTLPLQPRPLVLSWQGLEGRYRVTPDRNGEIELSAPGLVSRGASGSLTLNGLSLRGRAHKSRGSGLWMGDSSLRIGHAQVETPQPQFALEGIALTTEARETDGLVQTSLSYAARELQVGGDRIQDLRLKLTASNLDAAALKAYEVTMRQLARPPSAPAQAVAEALRAQLPALLARRPQLRIDEAQLDYQGSVLRLSGALRYVGINPHDAFSPLTDLAGEARLQLPRALLVTAMERRLQLQARGRRTATSDGFRALAEREADQFLARLNGSGVLLAMDDGSYTALLSLQSGTLSLNGRPLQGLPTVPQRPSLPGI